LAAFDLNAGEAGKFQEGMRAHPVARVISLAPPEMTLSKEPPMPPTYVLARDHLQRAATILQGADSRSRQFRYIIERTISLMDETQSEPASDDSNVLSLSAFRARRVHLD
jgi:hypothetical protein